MIIIYWLEKQKFEGEYFAWTIQSGQISLTTLKYFWSGYRSISYNINKLYIRV